MLAIVRVSGPASSSPGCPQGNKRIIINAVERARQAVLEPSRQPRDDQGDVPYRCAGNGVEGAELTLEPSRAAGPFYTELAGPGATLLTHVTTDGFGFFYNVPPGDYVVRITYPPDAGALHCQTTDAHGNAIGLPGPEENSLSVRVEPGRAVLAGIVFCTVD